jgi:DNA-binding PadR family transcriptional regulator
MSTMTEYQINIPLDDNLVFLINNEMVSEILWTLAFHKSLNLKKISQIINKKPASVLHNLKRLVKRDLIKLDSQATQKKQGKYYNISSKGYKLIEEYVFEFIEEVAMDAFRITYQPEKMSSPNRNFFQKLEKLASIVSNYHKIMTNLRYNFLRYNANKIKIEDEKWIFKKMDLRGEFKVKRINIENPDRQKRLYDFFKQFIDEGKKLFQEFKEEDKLIFKKTGKNPDSLFEGKKFMHVMVCAIPMIVEELD